MRRARLVFASVLLLVLALGGASARPSAGVSAAPELGWTLVASMAQERYGHTATPLGDGRVLVAGGYGGLKVGRPLATAEVYDPRVDRWSPAGRLGAPRVNHLALRLPNGRVMVAGGLLNVVNAPFAEVYDPATNGWSPLGPTLDVPYGLGDYPQLVALADGRLFVLETAADFSKPNPWMNRARVFDPATGALREVAAPAAGRRGPTLTLLRDGRVLVAGGEGVITPPSAGVPLPTVELYDPATDRWAVAAPLGTPRRFHAAVALADGRVLVVGGYAPPGSENLYTTSAELYDPAADRWTATGAMGTPGADPTLALLPDGRVVATGGGTVSTGAGTSRGTAEVYDPASGRWSALPPMQARRSGHTATVLPDGRVLVIGGYGGGLDSSGAQSAERYGPGRSTGTCFFQTGRCLEGRFLAYWEAHGGLATNGYPLTNERDERLEDGQVYRVQWFERVRLEHHPENAPPYDILLGHFGRRIVAGVPGAPTASVPPLPGQVYFAETGHNVGSRFLEYWQANGGLAQFGFPLSEEFDERLEDGRVYRVQYFERARFERHPENQPPYDVLLGQFGRRILAEVDAGR